MLRLKRVELQGFKSFCDRSELRFNGDGIAGIVGLGYTVGVARRVRKMTEYVPVFEDWLTHVILPVAAYLVLVIAAFEGSSHPAAALFAMAASAMVLLVVGIHNAWDSVTYIVVMRGSQEKAQHGRDRHR